MAFPVAMNSGEHFVQVFAVNFLTDLTLVCYSPMSNRRGVEQSGSSSGS